MDKDFPVLYVDENDETRILLRNKDSIETTEQVAKSNIIEEQRFEGKILKTVTNGDKLPSTREFMTYQEDNRFCKEVSVAVKVPGLQYNFYKQGLPVQYIPIDGFFRASYQTRYENTYFGFLTSRPCRSARTRKNV